VESSLLHVMFILYFKYITKLIVIVKGRYC